MREDEAASGHVLASSRRFRSFHAGSTLWKSAGVSRLAVPAEAEPVAVRGLDAEPSSGGSGRSASAPACRAAPRGERASRNMRASGTRRRLSGRRRSRSPASCTGAGCRCRRGSWRSRSATSMSARSWVNPRLDHDPKRGEVGPVRRERVRGNLPAALAERVRHVEDGVSCRCRPSSVNANTGSSSPRVRSSNGPSSAMRSAEPRRDVARVALHRRGTRRSRAGGSCSTARRPALPGARSSARTSACCRRGS